MTGGKKIPIDRDRMAESLEATQVALDLVGESWVLGDARLGEHLALLEKWVAEVRRRSGVARQGDPLRSAEIENAAYRGALLQIEHLRAAEAWRQKHEPELARLRDLEALVKPEEFPDYSLVDENARLRRELGDQA